MSTDSQSPEVSLYLHVPFCATKCAYCDFTSAASASHSLPAEGVIWAVREQLGETATLADAYCAAIPLFLQEFADNGVLDRVPSIYVGGGTPTVLGERLAALVERVIGMTGLEDGAEVTVEANPDSVTAELIESLVASGVTRFSLGVQSFDDAVLSTLGRAHDAEAARRAAAILAASGVPFSIDLICGVPGQTLESWRTTLECAVASGAGHASVYPLSIEEGTPLAYAIAGGTVAEPDADLAAEMMLLAESVLGQAGLARYEVASYARPGEEARHNAGYWTGVPYLGVGPSAASMLPVSVALETPLVHYVRTWPADWRARFVVNDTLESFLGYLWDRQPASLEALTAEEAAREDAMLGLRLTRGISTLTAESAAAEPALERLAAERLVVSDDGRWRTTQRGWLLGNEVFSGVWAGE